MNSGVQDGASTYVITYYVYDDMGHLIYTLPPKAVAASGSGTVSSDVRNKLCFHYVYDDQGRLVATSKPGQNGRLTQIVYDRKQRPVMRRTPAEKDDHLWEISFYDLQGRIIATSLFSNNDTREDCQSLFDDYTGTTYSTSNLNYYIISDAGEGLYPPETGITGNTMMSYIWYDDYSVVDPNNAVYNNLVTTLNFTPDLQSTPGAETPVRSMRTHGLVIGTKTRILPAPGVDTATTGDWTQTYNYYDDKGRLIDAESNDLYHNTPIHQHFTATQYDFSGKVLISKHVMVNQKSKDGVTTHTELTRNDHDGYTDQLVHTYHKVDGGAWNTLAIYKYDDLGRIAREILGDYGEVRDYDYNIRGQIKGINGHYAETGDKQSESRTFGESLKYDYGFTAPRYDGKIAGMVWRGSGGAQAKAMAYGYTYAPAGRLTNADFREGQDQNGQYTAPSLWDKDTMDYTVSNLAYDKNGNILSKDMRGPGLAANNVSIPATIDQLTYTYASNSNQLTSVKDDITMNYDDGDFQDGNTSANDYAYDVDGNLTKDLNKGISGVTYTYFDKPSVITLSNGNAIRYSYNAAGNKVQEQVIDLDAGSRKTDYIGNFVYQNDSLQYASTGVGRTVWSMDTVKEEFFVKDHLGNVRSIVDVYHYPLLQYLASYEIASAQLEEMLFDDVAGVRDDKPGSSNPDDTKAGRLNGADSSRVGTSILLKVMAGDRVEINADNYYDGTYNSEDDQPVTAESMVNSIVSTLVGGAGGLGESESHNPSLVPRLFNPENYTQADALMHGEADPARPKAFLNYILFDEHMQVVRTFTGAWQANGDGGWQTIGTSEPMTIPLNGYLAVYVSNASDFAGCSHCNISEGDVFFDKLQIKLTKGNLKEENHYYPYGLPMAAIGSSDMGMKRNRQKYQSNEYITDVGLNWMSFGARQYDPQLGRFLSVDPMADASGQDMLSPYHAMGDNPVSGTDPGGMMPPPPGGGIHSLVFLNNVPPVNPLAEILSHYSPGAIKMYFSGDVNVDPMNQSFWYDHAVGKDGKVYTLYRDMAGNIIKVTTGNDQSKNSGSTPGAYAEQDKENGDKGNGDGNPPTKGEADEHYLSGHGEPMYVDLSKVDLKFLDPTDFNEKKWTSKSISTIGRSKNGGVFGHITLTYIGNNKVRATLGYDDYNFEMHPWSNPSNWIRNFETIIGEPGQGTGFRIYLIGTGTISPLPQWRQNAYQMVNQFESYLSPYK